MTLTTEKFEETTVTNHPSKKLRFGGIIKPEPVELKNLVPDEF